MEIKITPKRIAYLILLVPTAWVELSFFIHWSQNGLYEYHKESISATIGGILFFAILFTGTLFSIIYLAMVAAGQHVPFEDKTIRIGGKKEESEALILRDLGEAVVRKDAKKEQQAFEKLKQKGYFNR
jgi:hypothetical protein